MGIFWSALTLAADTTETAEQKAAAAPPAEAAELKIANRSVIVFRGTLLGETPELRSRRARAVIDEALAGDEDLQVSIDPIQKSYLVLLGYRRAFIVTPQDLEAGKNSVREAAEAAAENLRLVVMENGEARNVRFLLKAAGFSAVATLLFIGLLRAVRFVRRKLLDLIPKVMQRHTHLLQVGHTQIIDMQNLYYLVDRLLWLLYWALVLLFSYQWLSFVLSQFPYTRPWGESLNIHLLQMARYLLDGILGAMPGLAVAVAIFFIARGISDFMRSLLKRMARPGTISWLSHETLQPTTRLTSLAIWLFALAMAYPYLPGAGTEAFKGLSVLIGLMISLGASSVVGQAAAGLILTYSRTLRPGEFVQVGGHEGTVTEMGMFTTTIRTGLGEMLTIPNSMITGSVTKNYSRTVSGEGYVVDTVVTIGYDTPWRQVEAMLLEAARRTEGILANPAPQVFQTALSDFYPEYRLVAQAVPSMPRPRAELLSVLHANIQDVFNEYGVQIMSPHYLGDPQSDKLVPREKWYAAPAKESPDS
nr:mechanosensitive ion channel family protein [Pseudomonas sp. BMS12]